MSILTQLTDAATSAATLAKIGTNADHGKSIPTWDNQVLKSGTYAMWFDGVTTVKLPTLSIKGQLTDCTFECKMTTTDAASAIGEFAGVYFGVWQNGSASTSLGTGGAAGATFKVDGVVVTTRDELHDAIADGAEHVFRMEGASLSAWDEIELSGLGAWELNGVCREVKLWKGDGTLMRYWKGTGPLDSDWVDEQGSGDDGTVTSTTTARRLGPDGWYGAASDATQGTGTLQFRYLTPGDNGPALHLPNVSGNDVTFPLTSGLYNYTVYYVDGTTDTGSLTSVGDVMTIPYNDAKFAGFPVVRVNFSGGPDINFEADSTHGDSSFTSDGVLVTINTSGDDTAKLIGYPVLRTDGNDDYMNGTFASALTEGHLFVVVDVLGSGGETNGHIFTINKDAESATGSFTGAALATRNSAELTDWRTYYATAERLTQAGKFVGRFLGEVSFDATAQSSKTNNANEDTASDDWSGLASNKYAIAAHSTSLDENPALDIRYILLYSAPLSDAESPKVVRHIARKYPDLGISLMVGTALTFFGENLDFFGETLTFF